MKRRQLKQIVSMLLAVVMAVGLLPTTAFAADPVAYTHLDVYKRQSQQELKWPLVLRYQELVKRIALQIRGIYSSFAQLDDVINEGILTLLDAVDKYDPDNGIKFETYVTKRIRGMVIALARRQDWTPRSVRRKAREIDQATWELYSALGLSLMHI